MYSKDLYLLIFNINHISNDPEASEALEKVQEGRGMYRCRS